MCDLCMRETYSNWINAIFVSGFIKHTQTYCCVTKCLREIKKKKTPIEKMNIRKEKQYKILYNNSSTKKSRLCYSFEESSSCWALSLRNSSNSCLFYTVRNCYGWSSSIWVYHESKRLRNFWLRILISRSGSWLEWVFLVVICKWECFTWTCY